MRAAVSHVAGPPESLSIEPFPVPEPATGEIRVRVRAAAVNFPDILVVADTYQVPIPRPFIPGNEFAGEVDAVGSGITRFKPGDRVVGASVNGAFAEFVVAAEADVEPLPPSVDPRAAAGFLVAYRTAYHSLYTAAKARPGETVLVLGAAGGVGLAAVQIAHDLGATVIAGASTVEKLARCVASGADFTVDYGSGDLRARLREIAPDGIDVVIDPVGGTLSEPALRSCARNGRFVSVGYASGTIPSIPLNLLLLKGVSAMGFNLRLQTLTEPENTAEVQTELVSMLAQGRLKPEISEVFPLTDTAAALRHLADRRGIGKVIVEVG
ncbi:MAG: qorA 1 [Pseudonocardiales bacterium]|nr:qorA 1 [Pseudonocardiales bacterium]